ncbi:DUF2569 domain-containing protein [Sphingorhabdus sp.]|uniref:DUF2569 domain-containing protein n=1 Tax=Sphingorhabdus sp. TaxID=1902408 RepID=UPI0032B7AA3B
MQGWMKEFGEQLHRKSVWAIASLEHGIGRLIIIWVMVAGALSALRIAFAASPIDGPVVLLQTILPYILVIGAPVAACLIGNALFQRGALFEQPQIRLARYGKWNAVDCLTARQHKLFGPTGIMASLVIGMMINVPVRSLEFLAAVPAMNGHAPLWGQMLFAAMTTDVVVMNFLYMIAFMMALRNVPWFPRFLLMVWGVDIISQVSIAHFVSNAPNLPVPVGDAMGDLLSGNVKKVTISVAIWLPYLLLSQRVNLTYRGRLAA